MAFMSNLLVCFGDSGKVASCDQEGSKDLKNQKDVQFSKVQSIRVTDKNGKNKPKGAPIPMSYYPIGSNFSRL